MRFTRYGFACLALAVASTPVARAVAASSSNDGSTELSLVVEQALEKACLVSSDPSAIAAAARKQGWPIFETQPTKPDQTVIASRRQIEGANLVLSIWRETSNKQWDGVGVVQCNLSFDQPRNAEMLDAVEKVLGKAPDSSRMANGPEHWWGFVVRQQQRAANRNFPVFDEKAMVAAAHSYSPNDRLLGVQVPDAPGPGAVFVMWYAPPRGDQHASVH